MITEDILIVMQLVLFIIQVRLFVKSFRKKEDNTLAICVLGLGVVSLNMISGIF